MQRVARSDGPAQVAEVAGAEWRGMFPRRLAVVVSSAGIVGPDNKEIAETPTDAYSRCRP